MFPLLGWLIRIGTVLILVNGIVLLLAWPLRQMRTAAGMLSFVSSLYWGFVMIAWCATLVHAGWGWPWTIAGLVSGGFGIVPVAFLLLTFNRDGHELIQLLFQVAITAVGYGFGRRLRTPRQ